MSSTCLHCSLPIPSGGHGGVAPEFCCAGCEAVHGALHACGLEQFYAMQQAEGSRANRSRPEGAHAALDHERFVARHCKDLGDGRMSAELRIDGLKCGACLWLLEAMPRLHPGLLRARIDLGRSVISLEWATTATRLSEIADRIAWLGYEVRPLGTRASREAWRAQDRAWLIDIGVAGAISGNVMAIAFALYGAEFSWMDSSTRLFLQWTSVAITALTVVWPGRMFLRNAWASIRTRRPHMDLPIALAIVSGLVGGALMTAMGRSGVYLESVSMLVFLLLVGRFVQFRQQRSARHEIELMCALVPQVARRVDGDGRIEEVPVDALAEGDLIEVPGGDVVSADGIIVSAETHVDRQWLTGESRPVRRASGDSIEAGVRVLAESPLRVRVTATGERTRAAAIVRMVEAAMSHRSPMVEFANRIAGWFLLGVIVAAVATGVAWSIIDPDRAVAAVIALLVVTCPCALGLATPLAMVSALAKAARAGVVVRAGETFEKLASRGTIVLDKTGTLTEGAMRVMRRAGNDRAFALAAALERHSTHPAAKAIVADALGTAPLADGLVSAISETAGSGISGQVGPHAVRVGNERFAGAGTPASLAKDAERMVADGLSPVFIAVDGQVMAVAAIGDPVRHDARDFVGELRSMGWSVWLLSGDLDAIAHRVGDSLGIDRANIRGECSPEAKAAIIGTIAAHPIVMIGDGINDLPAMARADVGIAVRQAAEATVAQGDVAIAGGGLRQACELLRCSRGTMRTIHVNFAISLAYNLVGGVLAATGVITPLIAAILMPLSGLTVTFVALRMPRFGAGPAATRSRAAAAPTALPRGGSPAWS